MKRVPLKVWLISSNMTDESLYYAKLFNRLEKVLPIQVDFRLIPWNSAFDTIMDAFKNNAGPDVFSLGTTWVHTFCYLGYLAPLPRSFPVKPPLAKWMTECAVMNGTRYAVPLLCETYVLTGKRKILDEMDIGTEELSDWDGFFSACRKIKNHYQTIGMADHIPIAFPIRPEMGTMHRCSVWMFKGGWTFPKLSKGLHRIFRDAIPNNALCYLSDIFKATKTDIRLLQTDTYSLYHRFLYTDQFTFFVGNGATLVKNLLNRWENNDITLFPIPSLISNAKTFGGGSVLTVSSFCKYKEPAWQLIEYLTRDEVLLALSAMSGNTPAYDISFWKDYDDNSNLRVLKEQHMNSEAYQFHPLLRAIEQRAGEYVARFFWKSLAEHVSDTRYLADQTLKELDESILSLLNMMWEM